VFLLRGPSAEKKTPNKMEARMEAEREARLADQQRMVEMFQYMQSLDAAQGFAPPPPLFPIIDPALFHTPVSIKIVVKCW
jgi:hypothetical protein